MILFPELNPVHFIKRQTYDHKTTFPLTDNFFCRESFNGVYAKIFRQVWPIDRKIIFQLQYDQSETVVVTAILNENWTVLGADEITPNSWNGIGKVYRYTFAPSATGTLRFMVVSSTNNVKYQTDTMYVQTNVKEALKINYYNSDNSLGAVFFTDIQIKSIHQSPELLFQGTIFLEGWLKTPEPSGEYISYQDDRGEIVRLQSTPMKAFLLQIFEVPEPFVTKLLLILACDVVIINNQRYMSEDLPESEEQSTGTNSYTVSVKMFKQDWGYFTDQDLEGYEVLGIKSNMIKSLNDQDFSAGNIGNWLVFSGGGSGDGTFTFADFAGTKVGKVTRISTGSLTGCVLHTSFANLLVQGQVYFIECDIWIPSGNNNWGSIFLLIRNTGAVQSVTIAANLGLEDQWQRIQSRLTMTGVGLVGNYELSCGGTGNGDIVYADNFRVYNKNEPDTKIVTPEGYQIAIND